MGSDIAAPSMIARGTRRLLDAIIWVSAQGDGGRLITCNGQDLPPEQEGIRVP